MVATVILAHPYKKSFNHAIFGTLVDSLAACGAKVYDHDLYEEGFDPVLTVGELGDKDTDDPQVKRYAIELIESDVLAFVHPNWWGQPPAIMKGYIDRVIRPPHAYDFSPGDSGGGLPLGRLAGKYGIVINTSNTAEERELAYFNDPLEWTWKRCVFGFCGIERSYRKMYRIVADSSDETRKAWLAEIGETVRRIAAEI